MTLANKITITRLIMIPIMVLFWIIPFGAKNIVFSLSLNELIAAIFFVVAAFTDFLDGYIARKYHQITNFGKFLDPIADKVLVISAMTYLIYTNRIEYWPVIIIIFREFAVTGIRLLAVEGGHVIAASPWGKAKTITTMIALIVMLFADFGLSQLYGNIIWYVAVALTLISGLDYVFKNLNVFKESKSS